MLIRNIFTLFISLKQDIITYFSGQVNRLVGKRIVSKFAYDGVKEVHKRRYLLQPIAVEVFCSDGQNQFLAFAKSVRPKVSFSEKKLDSHGYSGNPVF